LRTRIRVLSKTNEVWRVRVDISVNEIFKKSFYPIVTSKFFEVGLTDKELETKNLILGRNTVEMTVVGLGKLGGCIEKRTSFFRWDGNSIEQRIEQGLRSTVKEKKSLSVVSSDERKIFDETSRSMKRDVLNERE
jgi:hypothetical protein